jgi:hypothetical protein
MPILLVLTIVTIKSYGMDRSDMPNARVMSCSTWNNHERTQPLSFAGSGVAFAELPSCPTAVSYDRGQVVHPRAWLY